MNFGSLRTAEPLHIDLPNMLLESLSTALVKEVIWPRLAEPVRSAFAHALIWVSVKSMFHMLKRDAAARAIFIEVFDEMLAENAERTIDKNLPGYPTQPSE